MKGTIEAWKSLQRVEIHWLDGLQRAQIYCDKLLERAEFHRFKKNLGQNWSVKIITEDRITAVWWIIEGTDLAQQSPTEGRITAVRWIIEGTNLAQQLPTEGRITSV